MKLTNSENHGKSKNNHNKKILKIAGDKPMSEAFQNTFFKVFSVEQLENFDKLYRELESKIIRMGMNSDGFMKMVRDSYMRYQEYKNIDPFTPMDKKGFKYVEGFIRKSIEEVNTKLAGMRG